MKTKLILSTVLILSSPIALAAATLQVPDYMQILSINEHEIKTGLFSSRESQYKVNEGVNTISARYHHYFEHLNDEHDIVKSGVLVFTTPALKNETYRLDFVNKPQDYEQARIYAQKPTIALYNQQQQVLLEHQGVKVEQTPWIRSAINGIIDLTTTTSATKTQNASQSLTTQALTDKTNLTSPTLIQAWQQSSKDERQKFMSWLAEQSN